MGTKHKDMTITNLAHLRKGDVVLEPDQYGYNSIIVRREFAEVLEPKGHYAVIRFESEYASKIVAVENGAGFWHKVAGGPVGKKWDAFVADENIHEYEVLVAGTDAD